MGKATFAYRAARRLLGRGRDPRYGMLGMSPDDADVPADHCRLASGPAGAGARNGRDGKLKKNIPVDEVREIGGILLQVAVASAYRVGIIDAADDLNVNAANAVLKTLEEPPHKGMLFLISHSPGRLLPTIRSRCRRLAFMPWTDQAEKRSCASVADIDRGSHRPTGRGWPQARRAGR